LKTEFAAARGFSAAFARSRHTHPILHVSVIGRDFVQARRFRLDNRAKFSVIETLGVPRQRESATNLNCVILKFLKIKAKIRQLPQRGPQVWLH
jgi:hypothetical protein